MNDDAIVHALAGETLLHANALAAITSHCVVFQDGVRGAQVVLPIQAIIGLKKITTTRPGLLVVASGLFMIAAASHVSKQGLEATVPLTLLASLFVLGYVGTRRAAVLFLMAEDFVETMAGSSREATAIIRTLEKMRANSEPLPVNELA